MVNIHLKINITKQILFCFKDGTLLKSYPISSAKKGIGNKENSQQTPIGLHKIKIKIGAGCPINTVFVGRRPTGQIYSKELSISTKNKDWILSRIMWLQGLEFGVNRGNNVDTLRRHIYIHGTPDTEPMGIAKSHGCIRMRNTNIIELFDLVSNNTQILIEK